MTAVTASTGEPLLIFRVGALLCALPHVHVVEITRPLPIEPLSGAPGFVAGLTVLRGAPVPVVHARRLLQEENGPVERFIVVRAGDRMVAVAVDAVLGFRIVEPEHRTSLPPLLSSASDSAVAELGQSDGELLISLQASNLVPADLFDTIDQRSATA